MTRYRILTWHIHGAYLESLAATGHEIVLPVAPERGHGWQGRAGADLLPDTVRDVPADALDDVGIDLVLYQSVDVWQQRERFLGAAIRSLPAIYLEHDPPRAHPTDTRHPVDDPSVLLVHVTAWNALMWDCGRTPTRIIDHGISIPAGVLVTGRIERGITAINHLAERGRRLGADIYRDLREVLPLDLVGMGSERFDGLGELAREDLAWLMAGYRFYFHPVRCTSLAMAMLEAMMVGLPVVAIAATEVPMVITHGVNGFLATDPADLVAPARELLADPLLARRMGAAARRTAVERFSIDRFTADWESAFRSVAGTPWARLHPVGAAVGAGAARP